MVARLDPLWAEFSLSRRILASPSMDDPLANGSQRQVVYHGPWSAVIISKQTQLR